jgi:hypothetical protein
MSKISWPKELREYAQRNNRDLFAFGMDGVGGKLSAHCNVPSGDADKLSLFCIQVTRGVEPAQAFYESYCEWSKEPPTEQGEYWHWNGDEDCAPFPMFVLFSGFSGKCFVSRGQLGIERAIDCDQYGGWWMRVIAPAVPKTTD